MALNLRLHDIRLSVCRLKKMADVPADILKHPFTAFLRTPDEATLICPTAHLPLDVQAEQGWIAMELVGPFAFHETGILSQVAVPLAEENIPIYALSTFNTDYVLIKEDRKQAATEALTKAGHRFTE